LSRSNNQFISLHHLHTMSDSLQHNKARGLHASTCIVNRWQYADFLHQAANIDMSPPSGEVRYYHSPCSNNPTRRSVNWHIWISNNDLPEATPRYQSCKVRLVRVYTMTTSNCGISSGLRFSRSSWQLKARGSMTHRYRTAHTKLRADLAQIPPVIALVS